MSGERFKGTIFDFPGFDINKHRAMMRELEDLCLSCLYVRKKEGKELTDEEEQELKGFNYKRNKKRVLNMLKDRKGLEIIKGNKRN